MTLFQFKAWVTVVIVLWILAIVTEGKNHLNSLAYLLLVTVTFCGGMYGIWSAP